MIPASYLFKDVYEAAFERPALETPEPAAARPGPGLPVSPVGWSRSAVRQLRAGPAGSSPLVRPRF